MMFIISAWKVIVIVAGVMVLLILIILGVCEVAFRCERRKYNKENNNNRFET